ncbi:MAG: relaxase/mobilization nuclease domain-containing protein [Rhodospirillaceae bacterium]|nr:relaxase/mobilization nuclease domain-containing protein [Rhodospirillales bacterium]
MNGVKLSDGAAEDAPSMSDYPVRGEIGEKVSAFEHVNLFHEMAGDTMRDTARLSARCKRPLEHWMFSWQQGENPTDEQALEVGRAFVRKLAEAHNREIGKKGRKGAKPIDPDAIQYVVAVHRNTDNAHVHVVFNRVTPDGAVLSMYGDRYTSQTLCRETEMAQGWAADNGLVRMEEIDGVMTPVNDQTVKDVQSAPKLSNAAGKYEHVTGETSLERDAQEMAAPIVKQARSWQEVHEGLARVGMEIVPFGSGLVLRRGEARIKASAMGGTAYGKGHLEKRLGAFAPSLMQLGESIGESVAVRERQALDQTARDNVRPAASDAHLAQRWADYRRAQEATAKARKAPLDAISVEQRKALEAERDAYRQRRSDLFKVSWKGKGGDLNMRLSLLASEHAKSKARIRREHAERRDAVRAELGDTPRRLTWADWIDGEAAAGDAAAKAQQRSRLYIEQRGHAAAERNWGEGEGIFYADGRGQIIKPPASTIEHFDGLARPAKRAVDYMDKTTQRVAFSDAGNRVILHETERRSLIAGLELSAAKWQSGFVITGSDDFKAKALEAAKEAGLLHLIKNQELQERIQVMRDDKPWSKPANDSKMDRADVGVDLRRIWQLDPSDYLKDNGYTKVRGTPETGILLRNQDGRELSIKRCDDANWVFVAQDGNDRPASGRNTELVQHLMGWPRSHVLGKERDILAPYIERAKDAPLAEPTPDMSRMRAMWSRYSAEVDRSAYLRNLGLSDRSIAMAKGDLRMDRSGAHLFAHRTLQGDVVGYEMRSGQWDGRFARGGQKHLAAFGEKAAPRRIVVVSDAVDALSWSQRHNHPANTMMVSIAMEAGPWGKRDLADLVRRHPDAEVVLACRNDQLGKTQNTALHGLVEEARMNSSGGGSGGGQGGADKPAATGSTGGVSVAPPPAAVRVPDGQTMAVTSWNDLLMIEQGVRIQQANAVVDKAKEQTLSLGAGQKRSEEMQM